jgi:hypothetical protein
MKRINILDLHRTINEKKEKRIKCFEKVLEMTHNKIKKSSEMKQVRCMYIVPTFIFGYPLFDINECLGYVIKELKANGFIVTYLFPNKLYISWDLTEIDENKKHSNPTPLPANVTSRPNSLMKFKPSGKLELNLV